MSNLQIPIWEEQGKNANFAYNVKHINNFTLVVGFPPIADWENPKLRSLLHDRLYDDVSKLLRAAEFFSEDTLEQRTGADYFSVRYNDDIYDFTVSCYNNRLILEKSGVLLETFHHWYHAAVPGMKNVFESLLSLMNLELRRNQIITSVSYQFRFIAYDFKSRDHSLKNFQVLDRLITVIPGANGEILAMGTDPKGISRLDYKANYWDVDSFGSRRRLTYSAQGPANRGYSGLWLDFAYGSETYTDPESGTREAPDPVLLLDEYDRVYAFMWNKAIGGFMRSLLDRVTSFETTATYIP